MLEFEKISGTEVSLKRVYESSREMIETEEYEDFKMFVQQVLEAENTQLVLRKIK